MTGNKVIEAVRSAFPEIWRPIKIKHVKKTDAYAATYIFRYFPFIVIEVDKTLLKFSESAQIAVIAHEFAHAKFWYVLWLSESDLERKCDIEVIKKGFGKELLQFHKEHNKRYKKYKKKDGLMKKEIQKIIDGALSEMQNDNDNSIFNNRVALLLGLWTMMTLIAFCIYGFLKLG